MKNQNNTKTLKWVFKRCKSAIPLVTVISVLCAGVSLTAVYMTLLSKSVLDIATGNMQGGLRKYGIILVAVVLIQVLLSGTQSFLRTVASGRLTMTMRRHLFSAIANKKYSKITQYHSGDLLNRLTSDAEVIVSGIVSIIPNVVSMATKIIGGISTLIILDAKLALIVLVLGLFIPAIGRTINKRYKHLHKEHQNTEGKTRSFMQECFENTVVIKTFTSQKPFINRLQSYMKENYKIKVKRAGLSVAMHLGLYSFFTIGYYAVLVWGASQIRGGAITYGTLMAFLQLISQLRMPLQNVSGIMPQYYSAIASAERLMEVEDFEEDMPPMKIEKLDALKKEFSSLNFNNISFAYENELVLDNCNFELVRGSITALTGESGSGKSTVFKLILGLYEAESGNITINNETVLDTSMRGLFAYVPQGNLVLSGTVRDNLTLYNPNIAKEDIEKATKAAEIYDYIASLPQGFDTVLSERGAGLSEGQIQRISIARALLVDAPILLLDEATSALDEETEEKVLSNIKNMKDKTVLFVTHRHTSLKVCDKIVHFESK